MNTLWAALITAALLAASATGDKSGFDGLSVDFELVEDDEGRAVVVSITNTTDEDVSVEHPGNRYALAFLVMNDKGNVVEPRGLAKVDAAERELILKAGETFRHRVRQSVDDEYTFQFLSGTALFGYKLDAGKTYRVVAIYRPLGPDGEGICSREKLVELD